MNKKIQILILLIVILLGYQILHSNQKVELPTPNSSANIQNTSLKQVETLISNHQYQKALAEIKQIIELNNTNAEAIYLLSQIYLIQEKNDLAQKYLAILKKLKYDSLQIKDLEFLILYQKSQYQMAEKLIKNESADHFKLHKTSLALIKDDIVQAKKTLLEIQDPKFINLSNQLLEDLALFETFQEANLGYLHALIGKTLKDYQKSILAKKFLLKAVSLESGFRDAWVYLGHIYLQSQKFPEALKIYQKAKEIDPYHAKSNLYLGISYYFLHQYENAIKYIENSLNFKTDHKAKAHEFLALSLYAQGKNPEALNNFELSHKLQTLDLDSYANFIFLLLQSPSDPKLNSIYQRLQKVYPSQAMSLNLQGWIKIIQKDLAKAKQHLKQALKKDPHLAAAFLNLGEIHILEQESELAKSYLNKARNYARANNQSSIYQKASQLLESL